MSIGAITAGVSATQALAAALAAEAQAGDLVLLAGELGAGKTAFTQGFARGLGVTDQVTSPTFTLVRSYQGDRLKLHHVDVYRLDRLQEALDLGLAELVDDVAVTLIEWGDVIVPALPGDFLEIRLAYGSSPDERTLAARTVGSRWGGRRQAVAAALAPWGGDGAC